MSAVPNADPPTSDPLVVEAALEAGWCPVCATPIEVHDRWRFCPACCELWEINLVRAKAANERIRAAVEAKAVQVARWLLGLVERLVR